MMRPLVPSRMIERDHLPGERINTCQIGPLAKVAALARQSRIEFRVRTGVLPGNYVFNVMGKRTIVLAKETVFASVACPMPDQLPCGRIHPATHDGLTCVRKPAPNLQSEDRNEIRRVNQCFVFTTFVIGERSFVGQSSESRDSRFHAWSNFQRSYPAGRFGVKAAGERLEKFVDHGGNAHKAKVTTSRTERGKD